MARGYRREISGFPDHMLRSTDLNQGLFGMHTRSANVTYLCAEAACFIHWYHGKSMVQGELAGPEALLITSAMGMKRSRLSCANTRADVAVPLVLREEGI